MGHFFKGARHSRPDQAVSNARKSLRNFRQGSALAVALTSVLFLVVGSEADGPLATSPESPDLSSNTIQEATGFLRSLFEWFQEFSPKILIAAFVLLSGWLLNRLIKSILRSKLKNWSHAEATSALVGVAIFLISFGTALSALAGDIRALLGSVGLVGLALSWALQAPIESFTAWLLNCFRGYYAVGDRIEVGEAFGDVFRIDILTTTVWQAGGGPHQSVHGAQPTGALITFPNSEVLRSNTINYTRDFPYVWDEITIGVSNDSDLHYTINVFRSVAVKLFGETMLGPAKIYQELLQQRNLCYEIQELPSIFAYPTDSWTQIVIRYLVHAREKRKWSTALYLAISEELGKSEHKKKIVSGYPRSQVELVNSNTVSE